MRTRNRRELQLTSAAALTRSEIRNRVHAELREVALVLMHGLFFEEAAALSGRRFSHKGEEGY